MDASLGHLQEERNRLQEQLEDMKDAMQQLDELKDNVATLTADNERLQKQNSAYEYDNAHMSSQLDELTSSIHSLQDELQKSNEHINQLNQDISQRDNSISTLQMTVQHQQSLLDQQGSELQQKSADLQKTLQAHQEECADYERRLQAKSAEFFQLQSEAKTAEASAGSLSQRINELETMNGGLRQEVERISQRAHGLLQSVRSIVVSSQRTTPVKMRGEESDGVEGVLESLQEWCQGMQKENRSLQEELNRVEKDVGESYSMKIRSVEDEMAVLRRELESKASELSLKENELESLKNELTSLKTELNSTQSQLQSQLDANATQYAQLQALQQELKSVQDQLSQAQQDNLSRSFHQAPSDATPLQQLVSLQTQLTAAQTELSEKRVQISALESQLSTSSQRLQEAVSTLKALEASYDELKAQRASSNKEQLLQQQVDEAKAERERLLQQINQYSSMYSTASAQLGAKIAELEQLRQLSALKEQEYARLNACLRSNTVDASVQQLNDSIRLKDQRIAQLESETQRLTFSLAQAKRDSEMAVAQVQQQLRDLQVQLDARQQDATAIATTRAQLAAKQQENARLQQQLMTEIGLVESLKASYNEIDRVLSERVGAASSSSLQAILQAKEDHNKYLQSMIASLEAKNRELLAQKLALESQTTQSPAPQDNAPTLLQRIIALVAGWFPEALVSRENVVDYTSQLCQKLRDEKALYAAACEQMKTIEREKAELVKKVTVLQSYAAGHNHIDAKADAFVQDVIRVRNDFEQKFVNAAQEVEQKKVEIAQLRRSLQSEKQRVMKLLGEKKEKDTLPSALSGLIEECMNICLLAKLDKDTKLKTLPDIVSTLKDVRRGLSGTLNLLKRENERLSYENKRIRELAVKDKKNEERINAKIKQIIVIVQNQGKALKEFVLAFQAIQKK